MEKKAFTKLNIAGLAVAGAHILEYFALGIAIFKNMWYTSPALPFIGAVIAFIPLALQLLNIFLFKRNWVNIAVIGLSLAASIGYFFFFAFVLSKLTYFFIAGAPYFITAGLAALIAFFVFLFPKLNGIAKRIGAICVSAVLLIILLVCAFDATPFYISGGATVFAVEDEYQIAFATSHKSVAEVTVNGKTYCDSANGEKNVRTLHKISVPASELDKAGSYTVCVQGVALNTAYLPSKGVKIVKDYSFRPVDESDGLCVYNLSDTHECLSGPANAAKFFGDKLDLLILNGDIINDVSSEYQISLIYKLAHRITGGSRPVIFTRGNHECNGSLAAELGKFVGCAERGFYYRLKTGSLSLLVLDTANDMADDNALISPVADFDSVRDAESAWLRENAGWNDGAYNLVIAHMAYPLSGYTSSKCSWSGWARELVFLTDGAQLAVCGHSHCTDLQDAGESENTFANYPVLRGSIRSNSRAYGEGVSPFAFTGTAMEINNGRITVKFTNAKKRVLQEYSLEV